MNECVSMGPKCDECGERYEHEPSENDLLRKQRLLKALRGAIDYIEADVSAALSHDGNTATLPTEDLKKLIRDRDEAILKLNTILNSIFELGKGVNEWKAHLLQSIDVKEGA